MVVDEIKTVETAVVIVGFRNADDIVNCLIALSQSAASPCFDVFICENGGREAYERLIQRLLENVCQPGEPVVASAPPFLATRSLRLASRPTRVTIGCANANLGYGAGVNAWLRLLLNVDGWKGAWILNPDAEPAPDALAALARRAEAGGKGMVGSTILEAGSDNVVRFRGGLRWRRLTARSVAIGLGERLDASFHVETIERAMDGPSGASTYVTRRCIEQIGLMEDSFFLFYEDLDWGLRAKKLGLGYAGDSNHSTQAWHHHRVRGTWRGRVKARGLPGTPQRHPFCSAALSRGASGPGLRFIRLRVPLPPPSRPRQLRRHADGTDRGTARRNGMPGLASLQLIPLRAHAAFRRKTR